MDEESKPAILKVTHWLVASMRFDDVTILKSLQGPLQHSLASWEYEW